MSSMVESYHYPNDPYRVLARPGGKNWASREFGSRVILDLPLVTFDAATSTIAAQTDARIDNLLNPDVPFGRFPLSQFVALMTERYNGTPKPDGSTSATVVDDTAKDQEISSVTFTLKPRTTTARGGLSIAVRKKHGDGFLVHDLRLGAITQAARDYHHATIVRSFVPGSETICPITGDLLPAQLTIIDITELPETRAREDQGHELSTTGRKFCASIRDWAAEVSQTND